MDMHRFFVVTIADCFSKMEKPLMCENLDSSSQLNTIKLKTEIMKI